jgi:HPr kinase/phosphorylase
MGFLTDDEIAALRPARETMFPSPIPTQVVASDEFMPIPQTPQQRQVEARIKALADEIGARQNLSRRGFLATASGMAAAFLAMNDILYGGGSEIIKHHMEIRGLGIINIKDLFGISAVRDAKKIELVVELVDWNEDEEYDRLGVEELRHSILDVAVPMLRVPIRPGRSISTIIEVAARNQLLKLQGKHSAKDFQDRLNRALIEARPLREDGAPKVDEVE